VGVLCSVLARNAVTKSPLTQKSQGGESFPVDRERGARSPDNLTPTDYCFQRKSNREQNGKKEKKAPRRSKIKEHGKGGAATSRILVFYEKRIHK